MTPLPLAFLLQSSGELDLLRGFTFQRFLGAALVLFSAWLIIRYIAAIFNSLSAFSPTARFLTKSIEPVFRILLWFAAIFIALNLVSPSEQTFFAAIGSLALAIGLGAQDLIRNLIGGLVILADRPYQLGDRVRIGEAYGEIDHIGLRSTKLTTPDDTRVTIPNADILTAHAYNANSGVPDCQVVTDIHLPIDTDPQLAIDIGREAAFTSPYSYLLKPVAVLVSDEMARLPYLRLRIKAYVFDHRYEPLLQSDLTLRVKQEALRLGLLNSWRSLPSLDN